MRSAITPRALLRAVSAVVALGSAASLFVVSSAAAPTTGAAAVRTITLTVNDVGRGRWSTVGETDSGSMAMNYRWRGTIRFKVPVKALQNPATAKFSVRSTTTLTGNWVGDYTGQRTGGPYAGKYHCEYNGANVASRVGAQLRNGTKGKLELVLTAIPVETGVRFFPAKGNGATIRCSNAISDDQIPHFSPEWLFRDVFSDRGQLNSNTAFIVLPATMLPRGTLKVKFPREIGQVDSPLRPKLTWNNVGTLTATAR